MLTGYPQDDYDPLVKGSYLNRTVMFFHVSGVENSLLNINIHAFIYYCCRAYMFIL